MTNWRYINESGPLRIDSMFAQRLVCRVWPPETKMGLLRITVAANE